MQVAYAVADVRAAADRWATTTGAGPFFVIEHIPLTAARVGACQASSIIRRRMGSGAR